MLYVHLFSKQTVKEAVYQGTGVLQKEQLHHQVGQALLVSLVMAGQAG